MHYTYILQSESSKRHYIGSTDDLRSRLKKHNSGQVRSTKYGMPWKIAYYEGHQSKTLARKSELFYKTSQGRRQIKKKLGLDQ